MLFEQFQSDALTRNLDLTKIAVVIPQTFQTLEDAVRGYAGKEKQARELLLEYHHKYRNWHFVVQETQRYAVGNLLLYRNSAYAGKVIYLLSTMLLDALISSEQFEIRSLAADHLLAYWLKLLEEMPGELAKPALGDISAEGLEHVFETDTSCHAGILRHFFRRLLELPEAPFQFLLRSFYPPKRLCAGLLSIWEKPDSMAELREFLERFFRDTYLFWLGREDPYSWLNLQDKKSRPPRSWLEDFAPLSHARLREHLQFLDTVVAAQADHRKAVQALIAMTDFHDLIQLYLHLPEKVEERGKSEGQNLKSLPGPYVQEVPGGEGNDSTPPPLASSCVLAPFALAGNISMLVRLKLLEVKGLEAIHEEVLREINFEIGRWIRQESGDQLEALLGRILKALGVSFLDYPQAALQIIRTMGLEIVGADQRPTIDFFLRRIIRLGFQSPMLGRVSDRWQITVNPSHLLNVRVWLDIIKSNPLRARHLLSALIVNLSIGGIFVRDTDLFQKDVSLLLNSSIRPVYNLVKQLAKLFPVYFSQIGAEGLLRKVSTDIDELTARSDKLVHFLRKQSHVESNNRIVTFIQAIIDYWRTKDKKGLEGLIPEEVYTAIPEGGPLIDDIHRVFEYIFRERTINHVQDLLDLSEAKASTLIGQLPGVSENERSRAFLMIQFYQLLHEKYALSFKDINVLLQRAQTIGLPDPVKLLGALEKSGEDKYLLLDSILDYLGELKEVILTPGELKTMENIYYKRHIAVDIPSMYGSYNEPRFDALGLTFRLENLANVIFEEIILSINLGFITKATFYRIARFMPLFIKALEIDGISSSRLQNQNELFIKALEIPRFSHSQYIDIFRGFSETIKQIIQTHYDSVHDENLELIIKQLGSDKLIPRLQRDNDSPAERTQRVSESFLRDLIARTFGLQYFDHFIASILTTLSTQRQGLSVKDLDLLLSYDPGRTVTHLYYPNLETHDPIYMGGKGHTLTNLHTMGIRIPPGFVITTEYFRCRPVIECFCQPREDFEERVLQMVTRIEVETGRKFGHPGNPLLFSVRSGSAVSMPGMMNTFLNVGINEQIVEGLISQTGEVWFAWDNYRRFIQSWGMSFGIPRDEFTIVMNRYKRKYRRAVKREFSPDEIRELSRSYREVLRAQSIEFSESPRDQLFTAIRLVVESWESDKARTYREIMMLSDNWGTAVSVQAMVFGNLDTHSGAGVLFTHDPRTSEDKVEPVGDFTWGNQGEDVVGGLVKTLPISERQRIREDKETSLEALFPRVYKRLQEISRQLVYENHWAPQELEFTFQGESEAGVYVLQSRNMTPRIKRSYPVFKKSEDLKTRYLGSGIGVSGGAISGLAAFDLESLGRIKKEQPEKAVILIRSDTVPDDIHEISIADGVLTAKGGATSHAAIVAHRLGKTCVVGLSRMKVRDSEKTCHIDGFTIKTGDWISLDGRSGAVYSGTAEIVQVDLAADPDDYE
ncbi:MAG: PEP/pyruvate-binding domain-containing protein [Syntrophobacteraceae bacterium]|nr:PEP/pyruvate-binding domain-containing protein [Syntrophobacteraceae bacterium]